MYFLSTNILNIFFMYILGDTLSSNLDEFFNPSKLNRRASSWSVGSYATGDNINTGTLNQSELGMRDYDLFR